MIKNYQLDEVITVQRFRSQIAEHFRSVPSSDFRVLDVRMFKARAEATVRGRPPCERRPPPCGADCARGVWGEAD